MVYLHSYFNRKSEASVGLLDDKKRIKSNDMNVIMQHVNQTLKTSEKISQLLDSIDSIQRHSNQGMIGNAMKLSLFSIGFSIDDADILYENITKLAQHRNTFFNQTKWNWFGLNRTDGIIQVRKLLEAKKASVPQEEKRTLYSPIQLEEHLICAPVNTSPVAHHSPQSPIFHVSQCQQVAANKRDIFEGWDPYPSVSNNGDTPLKRAKSLPDMVAAFVTNGDTPINRAQSLPNEKYGDREKLGHQILIERATKRIKGEELRYSPADSSYFDLELDKNNITPQNSSPSVECSPLHELLYNHQNPKENV